MKKTQRASIGFLFLLLFAALFGLPSPAAAKEAAFPLRAEFTYHHWLLRSLLKTAEDRKIFQAEIAPMPEGFPVKVSRERNGVVQIEAQGERIALAYSQPSQKLTLNGRELSLSNGSSFAEIHRELRRALLPPSHAVWMDLLLPKAQAAVPAIVAWGVLAGAEFWVGAGIGAAMCINDRYPGGKAPLVKTAWYFLRGPFGILSCTGSETLFNVHCPSSMAEPIQIDFLKNTARVQRDATGDPTFVSVIGKNGREIFSAKVSERGPSGWLRLHQASGKLPKREEYVILGVDRVARYCSVAKKTEFDDIDWVERSIKDFSEEFPDENPPEAAEKKAE